MAEQQMGDPPSTRKKKVHFIVTGFGPFHGVPTNPTTVLVQGLVEYLQSRRYQQQQQQQQEEDEEDPTTWLALAASLTETIVLETSAEGARQEIDRLYQRQYEKRKEMSADENNNNNDDDYDDDQEVITIVLHLGVNYTGTNFQLEACAYNDASFRVPDEKGFQPMKVSILGNEWKVGMPLWTTLDVAALVDELNRLASQENVLVSCNETSSSSSLPAAVVSNDPGRFVCNYTYCYSLNKFQCHQQVGIFSNARCLFLHVPPFDKVSKENQFWFVAQLMKCLHDQVCR